MLPDNFREHLARITTNEVSATIVRNAVVDAAKSCPLHVLAQMANKLLEEQESEEE